MSHKKLIRNQLDRISEVTGETYVLDYNRSRGGYIVWAKKVGVPYNCEPSHLLCFRAPGRELCEYLKGVLWGIGVCESLTDKKIDYLRFIEAIDKDTRKLLKKELDL